MMPHVTYVCHFFSFYPSQPFLKTTGEFSIKDTKFNGVLSYQFKKLDDGKLFLESLDKTCSYIVSSVENKKSINEIIDLEK
jgi:hypothetical protein